MSLEPFEFQEDLSGVHTHDALPVHRLLQQFGKMGISARVLPRVPGTASAALPPPVFEMATVVPSGAPVLDDDIAVAENGELILYERGGTCITLLTEGDAQIVRKRVLAGAGHFHTAKIEAKLLTRFYRGACVAARGRLPQFKAADSCEESVTVELVGIMTTAESHGGCMHAIRPVTHLDFETQTRGPTPPLCCDWFVLSYWAYMRGLTARHAPRWWRLLQLSIACEVGRAVAALHDHGIVHRDIKRENVVVAFIERAPSRGQPILMPGEDALQAWFARHEMRVQLIDFEGAVVYDSVRRTAVLGCPNDDFGTPLYQSAELVNAVKFQATTFQIVKQSDVFAVATSLACALGGGNARACATLSAAVLTDCAFDRLASAVGSIQEQPNAAGFVAICESLLRPGAW